MLDEAEKLFTNYDLVSEYLTGIPHENSLNDYSLALQKLNVLSATEYDNLFIGLMETKKLAKERVDKIIMQATSQYTEMESDFGEYKTLAEQDKILAEQKIAEHQSQIKDLTLVSDTLSTEILNFENQIKLAEESVTMKTQEKSQYETYLSFISLTKKGDGFVINVSDSNAILVFITPIKQAFFADMQPVYIFTGISKTLLGQGVVTKNPDGYYLSVEDTSVAERIFMDDIISLRPTL